MSDAAEKIYPTHGAAPASPPATPAPVKAAGEVAPEELQARLLYPSMKPPEPAKPPAAEPAKAAGAAAAPVGSQVAAGGDAGVSESGNDAAGDAAASAPVEELPEFIATAHPVAWGEPAADAAMIRDVLEEVAPMDPEATVPDRNARRAFAAALEQVGVGQTVAREIFSDIATFNERPFTGTSEQAAAALDRIWGDAASEHLAAAKGVIVEVEKAYPGVKDFLNSSGLGNNPAFIRKIAAFAHARARRS